jgi:hypothetical protein
MSVNAGAHYQRVRRAAKDGGEHFSPYPRDPFYGALNL